MRRVTHIWIVGMAYQRDLDMYSLLGSPAMTDVKLEDAERIEIELRVVSRMLSRDLKDAAAFSCHRAAALLRKIPELTADLRSAQEAVLNNCARLHLAERSLAERTAELEAERTRAHNLAEYIRERV
jgi:hypothetical protein